MIGECYAGVLYVVCVYINILAFRVAGLAESQAGGALVLVAGFWIGTRVTRFRAGRFVQLE